jgi:hypothetical protein
MAQQRSRTLAKGILCTVHDDILYGALEDELTIFIELSHTHDFSVQEIFRLVFLRSSSMSGKNALFCCFRDG